jgi:hypothetical protein
MYGDYEFSRPIVLDNPDSFEEWGNPRKNVTFDLEGSSARIRCQEFFRNYRHNNLYVYRDTLIRNWNRGDMYIEVDLAHINEFDEILYNYLQVVATI